jgi:hypothetical protein
MLRSFRTPGDAVDGTQGVALGWYAVSRWDTRNRSCSTDQSHSSAHLIELRQVILGACPRLCKSPGTRGETSAHRGWMIDWLVARKKHPVNCPLLLARTSLSQVRGSCGPEDRAPREPRRACRGGSRTAPTKPLSPGPTLPLPLFAPSRLRVSLFRLPARGPAIAIAGGSAPHCSKRAQFFRLRLRRSRSGAVTPCRTRSGQSFREGGRNPQTTRNPTWLLR